MYLIKTNIDWLWIITLFLLPHLVYATVFDIPLWARLIYYFSIPIVLLVIFLPLKCFFSWKASVALTVVVYLLIGAFAYWQLVTMVNMRNSPVETKQQNVSERAELVSKRSFYIENILGWPLSISQQVVYQFIRFPELQY